MKNQKELNQKNSKIRGSSFWKLKCKKCKWIFAIDEPYIGVVTCPYCGEYVEGKSCIGL